MTLPRPPIWGELLQLAGLVAVVVALVYGWGHWRFEGPAALGFAALYIGRRIREAID